MLTPVPLKGIVFAAIAGCFCCSGLALADRNKPPNSPPANPIHWVAGPITAKLGDSAEITVPKDFVFTDGEGARKFMQLTQNPVSNQEVGLLAPRSEKEHWFVIFEFDPVGFVKDDEKSKLDSDALLKSIKEGTEEANETRKKNGWTPYHVVSWYTQPHYDEQTHNLTWAINGQEEGNSRTNVNYSVRILGRRGTMNVDLVLNPEDMARVQPVFNSLMGSFHYTGGNRYAEFMKGDKLAGYGLTALIAGGAGAVAIKTGLLAKFWKLIVTVFAAAWKLIVVAFAALGAFIKRMWGKIKSTFSKEPEFPSAEAPALASSAAATNQADTLDHAGR